MNGATTWCNTPCPSPGQNMAVSAMCSHSIDWRQSQRGCMPDETHGCHANGHTCARLRMLSQCARSVCACMHHCCRGTQCRGEERGPAIWKPATPTNRRHATSPICTLCCKPIVEGARQQKQRCSSRRHGAPPLSQYFIHQSVEGQQRAWAACSQMAG